MENNQTTKKNVNLLPDDLRKREDKEATASRKQVVEIPMTDPKQGFTFNKEKNAKKGPGFWSSLFKKNKGAEAFADLKEEESKEDFSKTTETDLDDQNKETVFKPKKNRKSWLKNLFGTDEEKERKRTERLALARAREESMRHKKEAVKRLKLEKKAEQQQKDKTKDGFFSRRRMERDQKNRMRQLMLQDRREEKERLRQEKERNRQTVKEIVKKPQPEMPETKIKEEKKEIAPSFLTNSSWLKEKPEPEKKAPVEKKKEELSEINVPKRQASDLDVNLIPEELLKRKELKLSRQLLSLVFSAVACLIVIGVAYFGLVWYENQALAEIAIVDSKITNVNKEISKYDDLKTKAVALQKKLKAVEDLFGQHLYWTEFFKKLENYTIPDVSYTNFLADSGNGSVVMSASASSYRSVAEQLVSFQKADDFIEEVVINSASGQYDEESEGLGGVLFNVSLKLKPSVFLKEGE